MLHPSFLLTSMRDRLFSLTASWQWCTIPTEVLGELPLLFCYQHVHVFPFVTLDALLGYLASMRIFFINTGFSARLWLLLISAFFSVLSLIFLRTLAEIHFLWYGFETQHFLTCWCEWLWLPATFYWWSPHLAALLEPETCLRALSWNLAPWRSPWAALWCHAAGAAFCLSSSFSAWVWTWQYQFEFQLGNKEMIVWSNMYSVIHQVHADVLNRSSELSPYAHMVYLVLCWQVRCYVNCFVYPLYWKTHLPITRLFKAHRKANSSSLSFISPNQCSPMISS